MQALTLPLGLIALGGIFFSLAWLLLVEYRRVFLSNPRELMSLEVLGQILELGAPGYLAALALLMAAVFIAIGGFVLLMILRGIVDEIFNRLVALFSSS